VIAEAASDGSFTTVAVLALLGLAMAALAWWQRSRGTLGGGEAIRLVAVRGMGGKRLLALVEVEQERFLLGLTEERIDCLARVAGQGDAAPAAGATDVQEGPAWSRQSA
jgi:flagellar biogenesis protein FliO